MIAVVLIKSAIVLLAAACIASALRRQSAALRHAIWTAGLAGALAVPLCSVTLPPWQSGMAGRFERLFQPAGTSVSSAPAGGAVSPASVAPATSEAPGGVSGIPLPAPAQRWTIREAGIFVWLGGAALGMLLMMCGALRLAWVAIGSEPVTDARWLELAERVRQSLGFRRPVRLLQSQSRHFLGTWGILVPRVLLPASAGQWSDDRAWMVLGHELAHIKRHDWLVQVLAEAARAIYWFNPIFWLAYARLRRESEQACDDTVIRMGAGGTQYAEELLNLAKTLRSENQLRSPILAMAQPSHLERRLVALLDPALNRLAATPWSVIVVALAAIGLTLPLAAIRAPEKVELQAAAPVSAPVLSPVAVKPPLKSAATPAKPPDNLERPKLRGPELPRQIAASAVAGIPLDIPSERLPPGAYVSPALTAKLNLPAAAAPRLPAPPPFECTISPSVRQTKMKEAKMALGSGPWHINEDQTIWAWDQPYIAGTEVNTMWMKPANADLVISGRRLDGESAPLQIHPAKDITAGYIATGLVFPKAGCWEVTATAGSSTLTFITKVEAQ